MSNTELIALRWAAALRSLDIKRPFRKAAGDPWAQLAHLTPPF